VGAAGGLLTFGLLVSIANGSTEPGKPASGTASPTLPRATCDVPDWHCSPRQIDAAFAHLYEEGGATPAEAKCLARIITPAFVDAGVPGHFKLPSGDETPAEISCVGSVERLRVVRDGFGSVVTKHARDLFSGN
jgi:hypothetical protein